MDTSKTVRVKVHKMKRGDKLFYIALMIWPVKSTLWKTRPRTRCSATSPTLGTD